MALSDLIRAGLRTADSLTGSLQATVQHHPCTGGSDGNGVPVYGPPVARRALVESKSRLVRSSNGEEVMSKHSITFLRPVSMTQLDKIVLPDGSTGPILSLDGLVDAGTGAGFYSIVLLGAPGGPR